MNRQQRRRKRLESLIQEAGSQKELAELAGTVPNVISQILNGPRNVTDDMAERLERAMGKPDGWMDQWLPDEGGWASAQRHPDWYLFDRFQEIRDEAVKKSLRDAIIASAKSGRKHKRSRASN